jgi:hypothetical protein
MGGFDWAAGDYLSDALDAAERRADRAEEELQQGGGGSTLGNAVAKMAISAGTAGTLGWWSGTKGGMVTIGGVLPVNLAGGILAKAIAFFGARHLRKVPAIGKHLPMALDSAGQGAIDQFAAMAGYFSGQKGRPSMTKGASTAGAATGRNQWQGAHPPHPPAMGGGSHPTDYMTPDQRRVWESYAP